MNISNLTNLFQQNSIFQHPRPLGQKLGQPPITDALRRLSENYLTAQAQGQELQKRFDTLELSTQATGQETDAMLNGMPEELLDLYLNQYKVSAYLSQQNEAALMTYRDQLSAFDQTIGEYQNMLDGKAELPETMNEEDISMLLEQAKAAREQFLQDGANELNRIGSEDPGLSDTARQIAGSGQTDFQWSIDVSAEDIYAEIDQALTSAHRITSICREGASRIANALKQREDHSFSYRKPQNIA